MVKLFVKMFFLCITCLQMSVANALSLNGFSDFSTTLVINARSAGVVDLVKVIPGQRVKKGDLLISLDVTAHQANLEKVTAIEKSLLPAYETAQLELERALELYDRDSLSQIELKNAENKLAIAEGNYHAALADAKLAQYQLSQAIIKSPIAGRVLQIHVEKGQYVDPAVESTALITVVKTRTMKAVALLTSDQWDTALINRKATVKYRDRIYQGRVSQLGYQRVEQTGGLPAYELQVTFKTDKLIPAEMPVTIEIED